MSSMGLRWGGTGRNKEKGVTSEMYAKMWEMRVDSIWSTCFSRRSARCVHLLFEEPIDSLQAPFWYISMRSSTITCFRYSFKFGSRSFVDFGSNPVNSSNVEASSLDL